MEEEEEEKEDTINWARVVDALDEVNAAESSERADMRAYSLKSARLQQKGLCEREKRNQRSQRGGPKSRADIDWSWHWAQERQRQ